MSTLYWLTIIGNINTIAAVALTVFVIICLVTFLEKDEVYPNKKICKIYKISFIGILMSLVLCIIIPSKDDLYAIYGVGSVLDYAKNSKEVQKLPDNAVKALNIYLEDIQKRDSMTKQEK